MGHAPSIDAKISRQISCQRTSQRNSLDISPGRQSTCRSLIAHILDALHHSRRLQANGILHRYHHLLNQAAQGTIGKSDASSGDQRHVVQ